MKPLRVLFYKRDIQWPFRSGHDVHTFHMINALAAAGHQVGLVTADPLPEPVRESIHLELHQVLDRDTSGQDSPSQLPRLQERFRRFWGIRSKHLTTVQEVADRFAADAVVVSGLEVLPVLAGIRAPLRIWYGADEWMMHHLSQVRLAEVESWGNVRDAVLKGAYERVFCNVVDRVWAVSDLDAWAFRWLAGIPRVDVIPNGVDPAKYTPSSAAEQPFTAAFWGRLDFGPNIQGLQWLCSRVWPLVLERHPEARLTIIGFAPGDAVRRLTTLPGVTLCADAPDSQDAVKSHAVAVLPFKSGTGIKNKLLEAAAMGKATVSTRKALSGLSDRPPLVGLDEPSEWVEELSLLWRDAAERSRRGIAARDWVTRHHTWAAAASIAEHGIAEGLANINRR